LTVKDDQDGPQSLIDQNKAIFYVIDPLAITLRIFFMTETLERTIVIIITIIPPQTNQRYGDETPTSVGSYPSDPSPSSRRDKDPVP